MLRCESLSKTFLMHVRGGKRIAAFRDVSFTLDEGQFLGISGPSGSGKSSLLKCIYRTYLPSAGAALYTDERARTLDLASADDREVIALRRLEIGYISQFFPVIPRVSALDTVVNGAVARGVGRGEALERARELLRRLAIPLALWDMFPSTFSGGEKQRINIILAVIHRPRLLLLDEPTASLDSASASAAMDVIGELAAEGTGMIGVFHDAGLLSRVSDVVLRMPAVEAGGEGA